MEPIIRLMGRLLALTGLVALGAAGAAVYGFGRGQVVESIYKDKLAEVVKAHEELRARYEAAVSETIITEIVVDNGKVDVVVRSVEGVVERIPTELDPKAEIHVDYLVVDGRLFIRRVYDDATPPKKAQVIDPKLANIDWSAGNVQRGLTVYRGGLTEGRWLISATGNGALDLVKSTGPERLPLVNAPPVRKFDGVTDEIDHEVSTVKTSEVINKLSEQYLEGNGSKN